MPIVKEIETTAISKRKLCDKLIDALQLCDNEEHLKQWEIESDFTAFNGEVYWTEYLEQAKENRRILINQNKETKQCQ